MKNLKLKTEENKKEQKKKAELASKEYHAKEKEQREKFEEKTKGIEIELKDTETWNKSKKINSDPYSKCTIDYAEGWAKLMQIEINKYINFCASNIPPTNPDIQLKINDIANKTSIEMDFLGITGFMYGCAVSILASCWKYGEELRKWHNKDYKYDGEGVVNPAILSIG